MATTSQQIITCQRCGAKNRVRAEQWDRTPVCGRCKAPLHEGADPIDVTDSTFADRVLSSPKVVLVDFWAPWCGPCRIIAPTVAALAGEFAGRAVVAKLNTDENPATASRYRIDSIPALLLFKNGQMVDRIVGLAPAEKIRASLDAAMARG